jgi:hypothetical protein
VLEPGCQLRYREGKGSLVITVLRETRKVDDVETAVVEEREEEAGALTEVSRNYLAIDKETSTLEGGASHKWYAPGVGLIKDDEMQMVKVVPVGG